MYKLLWLQILKCNHQDNKTNHFTRDGNDCHRKMWVILIVFQGGGRPNDVLDILTKKLDEPMIFSM
jgi:hypothetical protein